VLLAQDNPIDAANLALASAAKAATVGAHLEAARSQAFAGRALLSAGEREHAAAELQAAAAQFESCDAMRGRDAVERELRRLGKRFHRRRQPGDTGVGALSGRELEIAELVTECKTNREIAAELFLSEQVIETHLRKHLRQARRLLPLTGIRPEGQCAARPDLRHAALEVRCGCSACVRRGQRRGRGPDRDARA
jgi:DNA-binding CsgD family transcriptional regulator